MKSLTPDQATIIIEGLRRIADACDELDEIYQAFTPDRKRVGLLEVPKRLIRAISFEIRHGEYP
jgi:hypothetical protein